MLIGEIHKLDSDTASVGIYHSAYWNYPETVEESGLLWHPTGTV